MVLRLFAFAFPFLLAASPASAQIEILENRLASGDVTQTTAVLWARSSTTGTHAFWYRAVSVPGSPWLSRGVEIANAAVPAKVQVDDLVPE
jgi:phosphodiesterase/alkaline phosphatase D-like protein